MDTIIATIKVAGTLQKSGQVMKMVNQLARLPEISQAMQQISMEMTKVWRLIWGRMYYHSFIHSSS